MEPTKDTVLAAIAEHDRIGGDAFLEKYASGRPPKARYLTYAGGVYPLKAIWAAAHRPPGQSKDTHTNDARRWLRDLGFGDELDDEAAQQYEEGLRLTKEVTFLSRHKGLVAAAKAKHGTACQACGFDFNKRYGAGHAKSFIECHHLTPLAKRDGKGGETSVDDVAVLCANCHRMAHRDARRVLSVADLQDLLATNKKAR